MFPQSQGQRLGQQAPASAVLSGCSQGAPGKASPCCLSFLLLPGLQHLLHHSVGTVVLVQGPEVLFFQGTPVAEDGQPMWVGEGTESPSKAQNLATELGQGLHSPEGLQKVGIFLRRLEKGRCLQCPHRQQISVLSPPPILLSRGPICPQALVINSLLGERDSAPDSAPASGVSGAMRLISCHQVTDTIILLKPLRGAAEEMTSCSISQTEGLSTD